MDASSNSEVGDYLAAIRHGGEQASEAALTLGLLIENAPEAVGKRLSGRERQQAVTDLIRYVEESAEPHPMAVWALTKSCDSRCVPPLTAILHRFAKDPRKEHLAYQALIGILNIGMTAPESRQQSLALVREAATSGCGEVADTARSYLRANARRFPG